MRFYPQLHIDSLISLVIYPGLCYIVLDLLGSNWKQQHWGYVRIPIIYIDSQHLLILPLCQNFLLLGEVKSGKTWHPLDEAPTWEGLIKMENVTCFWDKVRSQT